MKSSMLRRATVLGAVVAVFGVAGAVRAQAPYPPPLMSPEASEIAHCLCLHRAMDAQGADMSAKQRNLDELKNEVSRLDADMERERRGMDVNNPQQVARFRQLLERRDAIFRRQSGSAVSDASAATQRYNGMVNEYNARCANHPQDARLLAQIQSTLTCPAY